MEGKKGSSWQELGFGVGSSPCRGEDSASGGWLGLLLMSALFVDITRVRGRYWLEWGRR